MHDFHFYIIADYTWVTTLPQLLPARNESWMRNEEEPFDGQTRLFTRIIERYGRYFPENIYQVEFPEAAMPDKNICSETRFHSILNSFNAIQ